MTVSTLFSRHQRSSRNELTIFDRFATVRRDRVRLRDGSEGLHWRITSGQGFPGVVMCPWRDGRVGLVLSDRYVVGECLWELPRGGATSFDARANAARELWEETQADDVQLIELCRDRGLYTDSGIMDNEVVSFIARLAPGCPFRVREEIDAVRWERLDTVKQMILDGEIRDQFTVTTLALAEWRGLLV